MLQKIATFCDRINAFVGKSVSWFALFMVLVMTINVFMRYLFALGDPWQQELVRFMHAALFLLAAGYALQCEQHVRVDVLYQGMNMRKKALVNLIGTIVFLFPVAISIIYFSFDYVLNSWHIFEGSSEYKGLPGVFILKSCIWAAGGLLIIQGISVICRSLLILKIDTQYKENASAESSKGVQS